MGGFYNALINRTNPFLATSIIFGILLYFHHKKCKKGMESAKPCSPYSDLVHILKKSVHLLLLILLITSLICFLLLELFYHEQCPVDPVRYNQTIQIFTMNVSALKQMKIDHICYFGTLLYVLRQTLFGVWDQDSDIIVVKPDDIERFIDDLSATLSNISMGHRIVYYKGRDLIQVKKGRAHGDIWLYTLTNITQKDSAHSHPHQVLTNYDYTTSYPIIDYDVLFPSHDREWHGFIVPIPNQETVAAEIEFGDEYMTSYFHRMQCLENIVTNKVSPTRLIAYIVAVVFGNVLSIFMINSMANGKLCGRTLRKKTITLIVDFLPSKWIRFISKRVFNNFNSSVRVKSIVFPSTKDDEQEQLLVGGVG